MIKKAKLDKTKMKQAVKDKLDSLKKSGIEFVKYHFSDMQGHLREVTLTIENIKGSGVTSVDGSSVYGKIIPPTESDMLLLPDWDTLYVLPWSQNTARVICNVFYPPESENGRMIPFEGCARSILAKTEKSMKKILGKLYAKKFPGRKVEKFHAHFAPEIEFLLVPEDYDISKIYQDSNLKNSNYFVPPPQMVDATLQQITKALGIVGLKKEKYHTEVTTYQHEVTIAHGNVLQIADATMTIKYIIDNIARKNGLRASFIPKFNEHVNGSGMHVHQNLAVSLKNGNKHNLFYDSKKEFCLSDIGKGYFAGLLKHAAEITAITNPLPVSYKRIVPGHEAPTYIAWDWLNRTALCRGHSKGTHKIRVEYRAPDPTCNPYLAFAAMLSAGLSGIVEKIKLSRPDNRNFYTDHQGISELPGNLGDALNKMNQSAMLRSYMGNYIINFLYTLGMNTWIEYSRKVTNTDIQEYF